MIWNLKRQIEELETRLREMEQSHGGLRAYCLGEIARPVTARPVTAYEREREEAEDRYWSRANYC
jgi:hypothetical protein